jgi:hypothetical protein
MCVRDQLIDFWMQQRLTSLETHIPDATPVENWQGPLKIRAINPALVFDDLFVISIRAEVTSRVTRVSD